MIHPDPQTVVLARKGFGLTQRAAAALIGCSMRAYQQWEAGDRRMPVYAWELLLIKGARFQYLR